MTTKRKIKRNLSKQPVLPTEEAIMVETGKLFGDLKVFILVPMSTGLDPKEVARVYSAKIDELTEKAKQPTLKELTRMSAEAIPDMMGRALGMGN